MACPNELMFETIAISNLSLTCFNNAFNYSWFETIAISNLSLTLILECEHNRGFETIAISNLSLTIIQEKRIKFSLRLLLFLT